MCHALCFKKVTEPFQIWSHRIELVTRLVCHFTLVNSICKAGLLRMKLPGSDTSYAALRKENGLVANQSAIQDELLRSNN